MVPAPPHPRALSTPPQVSPPDQRGTSAAERLVVPGAFAAFMLLGYLFGRWYMNTGWGFGWRTSQFFFSYQELGFVKRALVGSLLQPFPDLQRVETFFALTCGFLALFLALFVRLFSAAATTMDPPSRWTLAAVCAASPALFLRQGFDFGRFDVLGLVACLVALGALAKHRPLLAGAASALALLAHEAYLILNLPLVLAFAYCGAPANGGLARRTLWPLVLPPAAVSLLIALFGGYEPGLEHLREHFARHAPYLAANGAVNEDAIAVLTRTTAQNVDFVAEMFWAKKAYLHLPVILAWGALMTWFFAAFYRLNHLRRDALFYAAFSPLLLSAIASDYYRWIALAATNMIFVILLHATSRARGEIPVVIPRGVATWVLIGSALLGPISNTKSFPLLFIALERIFPGLSW